MVILYSYKNHYNGHILYKLYNYCKLNVYKNYITIIKYLIHDENKWRKDYRIVLQYQINLYSMQ